MPTTSSAKPAQQQQQQQHITKVKITSPTRGQQVPVGKDLTISGTSIDNATASSTDCKVSVIANKIRPYQPATATGTGGAADYSKWKFDITSKYTTIKPGENRITAKYECANNPLLTAFSSVNVTGVASSTSNGNNTTKVAVATTINYTVDATGAAVNTSAKPSTSAATTSTTSPQPQTAKMVTSTKDTTNASPVPKSLSPPKLLPQSSITKTATAAALDQKPQKQHIPIRTNSNDSASSAINNREATRVQIPASKSSNDPIAATIAPQVKLMPQQNTRNQPSPPSQQQPRYQQAIENENGNTLQPMTSHINNIKPLTNVPSSDTQANESGALTTTSGQPAGNHSKSSLLSVLIKLGNDSITAGNKQKVTVLVSDATSNEKVAGAKVVGQVTKSSGLLKKGFQAHTDDNGQVSYSWKIKQTVNAPDTFKVVVTILAAGYQEQTAATSFTVNPSTSRGPSIESPFKSNVNGNYDNNLIGNRVHDFTNKILDDVKQNTKDKWIPRHFILPTPF